MKRWKKRTLAMLFGVVVSLVLGEVGVRVAGLGRATLTRGALHRYDPDAGWTCAVDVDTRYVQPQSFDVRVRSNHRGLRDKETPFEKPAGTRRVVVLGDSFMWGFGVDDDEMLACVLERELPNTEAVNLGANGYSTIQELVRLETEGVRYHPDVVVLAWFWNDLEDNFDDKHGGRPIAHLTAEGALEIQNRPVRRRWKAPAKQWLRHHSRLFNALEYGTETFKWKMKMRRLRKARENPGPPRLVAAPDAGSMAFTLYDMYAPPRPALDRAWLALELTLARIRDLAAKHGAKLVVVYNANREVMRKDAFTKAMAQFTDAPDAKDLDWDRPAKRLAAVATRLGVPLVDTVPAFRAAKDPETLFLKNNDHWSAVGHTLAGRLTARAIERLSSGAAADRQPPPR